GPDFQIDFEQRDLSCEIAVRSIRIPGRTLWLTRNPEDIFLHYCNVDIDVANCRKNHPSEGLCVYRGSDGGNYIQPPEQRLPVFLVATDDSHWLKHGCRSHFLTREVLSQFTLWLRTNVIGRLELASDDEIFLFGLYSHAFRHGIFAEVK